MKNKFFAIAILMIAFSANSFAQSTAYASTTATLVTPISIEKLDDMDFGKVASSATAGTIILDQNDQVSATGGASIPGNSEPLTATFRVVGEPNSGFSISIPSSPITLTGSVAGTLTVGSFICNSGTSDVLPGSGSGGFRIGATLSVPANSVAGIYTNNLGNSNALFVTVNYN